MSADKPTSSVQIKSTLRKGHSQIIVTPIITLIGDKEKMILYRGSDSYGR